MSNKDRDGYIVGIYRRLGEILKILGKNQTEESKPAEPREQTLPGLALDDTKHDAPDGCFWTMPPAGEIAKAVLDKPKPKAWCNAVKVYEYVADFVCPFTLDDMILNKKEIDEKTGGKVGVASYSRILSTLVRSGAVSKMGRRTYTALKPTDELREAVERTAKKRAAAKEVSA